MIDSSTCDPLHVLPLQDDGDHEDQLRSALGECMDEEQHSEFMGQVDSDALLLGCTGLQVAPRDLHHSGKPVVNRTDGMR